MNPSIRVVARFRARPDRVSALEALAKGLLAPTRAEPGCVRYELWRDRGDPARFAMVEEWRSQADLDLHFKTAHFLKAKDALPDLLAAPLEITTFELVG